MAAIFSEYVLRSARYLAVTPGGRFAVIAVPAGILLSLLVRDDLIEALGWGIAPAAAWLGAVLLIALARPRLFRERWQPITAAMFVSAAAIGVLGIFDGSEDSLLDGSTLGGYVGDILVREPSEWAIGDASLSQLIFGWLRVGELLTLATTAMWPARSWKFYARILAFDLAVARAMLRQARAWKAWIGAFAAKRRETIRAAARARAAASASVDTEAALQENPSYRVSAANPEIHGMVTDETSARIVPETLPTPAREELWTGAEASAVAALVSAAQSAAGVDTGELAAAGDGGSEAGSDGAGPGLQEAIETARYQWQLPSINLLKRGQSGGVTKTEIRSTSDLIVNTLADHGVDVSVDQVRTGPTVTMYGIAPGYNEGRPARGGAGSGEVRSAKRVRVDTILNREKDLALALASPSLRFEAPIPGASLVGIEVPNASPTTVALRSVMECEAFTAFEKEAALPVALGIASGGDAVLADLTRMPHTLVAGATGSGKSVCMNSIITGLLMFRTPAEVRLILIDPKRVELTPYAGAPHLMIPPIVEADVAVNALRAIVTEMMERYHLLEKAGAKNIAVYNEKNDARLPYLVIAVDELADLMLTSANEVERLLVRLAQLGRAVGIHLVVATQRPSVDVVTGLIKANFPSRISFSLTSQVDSRTIIDSPGAEKLLGKGDMLFQPIDRPKPIRVQGTFLTDTEVEAVVDFWRRSGGPPLPQITVPDTTAGGTAPEAGGAGGGDELFNKALDLAHTQTRLSTSLLQRRLRIGYPRAARLMDELEDAGVVGPGEPGKPRVVIG